MNHWKRISTKEVFTHPRMSFLEDRVLLPNGKEVDYLRRKDTGKAGVTVIAKKDGQILLSQEYSYPPDAILYQFPGGGVNAGEDPEVGADRELREETGYGAKKYTFLGKYYDDNRRSAEFMHAYLAEDLVENPLSTGDMEEEITSAWYTEAEIEEMIRDGSIVNVHALAAWGLYMVRKGR